MRHNYATLAAAASTLCPPDDLAGFSAGILKVIHSFECGYDHGDGDNSRFFLLAKAWENICDKGKILLRPGYARQAISGTYCA